MDVPKTAVLRTLIAGSFLLVASLLNPALAGPVNVNTADAATIAAELAGVGEKTAAAIVAYREEHGPFQSVDDLRMVKGIGDKIIEKNKDNILVSE